MFPTNTYFISKGELGKMFTLKQVQTVYGWNGSMYQKDVHIKTLANDYEKAIAKTKDYLGETPFKICATETEAIADKS